MDKSDIFSRHFLQKVFARLGSFFGLPEMKRQITGGIQFNEISAAFTQTSGGPGNAIFFFFARQHAENIGSNRYPALLFGVGYEFSRLFQGLATATSHCPKRSFFVI